MEAVVGTVVAGTAAGMVIIITVGVFGPMLALVSSPGRLWRHRITRHRIIRRPTIIRRLRHPITTDITERYHPAY